MMTLLRVNTAFGQIPADFYLLDGFIGNLRVIKEGSSLTVGILFCHFRDILEVL